MKYALLFIIASVLARPIAAQEQTPPTNPPAQPLPVQFDFKPLSVKLADPSKKLPDPADIVIRRPGIIASMDRQIAREVASHPEKTAAAMLHSEDVLKQFDELLAKSIQSYATNWQTRLEYRCAVAFWTTNHIGSNGRTVHGVPPPPSKVYECPVVELTADDEVQIQAAIAIERPILKKRAEDEAAAKAAAAAAGLGSKPKTNSTP